MRPKLATCCQLDLADPVVRALLDGDLAVGALRWRYVGAEVASARIAWTRTDMCLRVEMETARGTFAQDLQIVVTRPNFGGRRFWFATIDGATGVIRRSRSLVWTLSGTRWRPRSELRALYRSQLIARPAGLRMATGARTSDVFGEFAAERRARRLAMRRSRRRARLRDQALQRSARSVA